MPASSSFSSADSLSTYLSEINQHPLLTQQEEQSLSRLYRQGDLAAGHQLVTCNLRFVVKVAYEYRSYGLKMSDLIQEANIGLMKAVQKFDPDKGIRLISYAVWWIRAYIQNYILRSWSLVKLGTTQAQRRLFFSLSRTRRELEKLGAGDASLVNAEEIARKLNVKASEVREMEQRMGGRDLSLDAPMGEDGDATHLDFVESQAASQADEVADRQQADLTRALVQQALMRLDPRERFIIEQRVMSDSEMTLSELGDHFGFSRERARQLEIRAKDKLKAELAALMSEAGLDQVELAA
ncbi:RNA polymerase subunit sigma-70 [Corallococcus sp. H22C18031201]|uniref:RNA polymerase factor sigma-32 n=1 Tax=Citreicoccus inhibens TaxID=2849499 RepID=UPI000E70C92C|nr:RNA polymerase factor sigma-32 [Citreicoccus inhibens]MBJ6760940.1 RNA polymerase factor sigma-32 [Myxococcaceae bacterium JPH2]MBU8894290.1 RNA polymerase factor sigma-32 [Citreicoccus inhibens]RJS23022.1 RNA polymerase subunit sigma-70 [Corallococcus sp. H22C18031201]